MVDENFELASNPTDLLGIGNKVSLFGGLFNYLVVSVHFNADMNDLVVLNHSLYLLHSPFFVLKNLNYSFDELIFNATHLLIQMQNMAIR